MLFRSALLLVGILAGHSNLALCQETDPVQLQDQLAKSAEKYLKAYEARDAESIAKLFTSRAEYVDASGTVFHGREVIEAEFAAAFELIPPGKLQIDFISIRPIADGIVTEEGVAIFTPADGSGASQTRYAATHVRQQDGTWLIAAVRELEEPRMTPHERLKTLGWLEGAWSEEVGGTTSSTEWKWSKGGNFLIGQFTATDVRGVSLEGTQRIGWDAEREQFRSWVFDSSGGYAEGWWTPGENGAWKVQLNGADVDGVRRTSRLTYSHDGADGLVITQDQRTRGGVSLPAIVHRVVRQPPEPNKQAAR